MISYTGRSIALGLLVIFASGCITKRSIVDVASEYSPEIGENEGAYHGVIELDMRAVPSGKVTRFVTQEGGLKYDFTFLVHSAINETLPEVIGKFSATPSRKVVGNGTPVVVRPSVTTDINIYTKASAAPQYTLSIEIEAEAFFAQSSCAILSARSWDEVDIPAFSNTRPKRLAIMRERLHKQIDSLYQSFAKELNEKLPQCA